MPLQKHEAGWQKKEWQGLVFKTSRSLRAGAWIQWEDKQISGRTSFRQGLSEPRQRVWARTGWRPLWWRQVERGFELREMSSGTCRMGVWLEWERRGEELFTEGLVGSRKSCRFHIHAAAGSHGSVLSMTVAGPDTDLNRISLAAVWRIESPGC